MREDIHFSPDGGGGGRIWENRNRWGISDSIKNSPLFFGLDEELVEKLLDIRSFTRYGGSATVLQFFPDYDTDDEVQLRWQALRNHVIGNLIVYDEIFQMKITLAFSNDLIVSQDLSVFFPAGREEAETIRFYTELLSHLSAEQGKGHTVQELAAQFVRPYRERLRENMPNQAITWYISHNDLRFPVEFLPSTLVQWGVRLTKPPFSDMGKEDVRQIISELEKGKQPYVEAIYHPDTLYGIALATLDPEEIRDLADHGGCCCPECQFYHGYVKHLKELGELIAPVDAELFGERLFDVYNRWKEQTKEGAQRFNVLIPAQADETTITGTVDYLENHGIKREEIKNTFYFELSDLCITPLLRVYAAMKEREMLDCVRITSTDAFAWGKKYQEEFDFICADHFIDLFPEEGDLSQTNLLSSLVSSLAPNGEFVLTVRCGSEEKSLTDYDVMEDFYEKVNRHIAELAEQLKRRQDADESDSYDEFASKSPFTDTRKIIALLIYRQYRKVYPFQTQTDLIETLDQLKEARDDKIIDWEIERIKEGKVKIVIRKLSVLEGIGKNL